MCEFPHFIFSQKHTTQTYENNTKKLTIHFTKDIEVFKKLYLTLVC
ncbi:conserved hypothetical protein [Leptospira interrogans serovar Manilae]|uniref:Uncharacterized protein n=1 Tax=Leptospira interrogans serovar Manilae TaxID=214675 RepID=A0AAQ1SP31_LEPIR|nr:conserved hypothetical protein [Leptospira interrogans serovar Manilae]